MTDMVVFCPVKHGFSVESKDLHKLTDKWQPVLNSLQRFTLHFSLFTATALTGEPSASVRFSGKQ